MAKAPKLPAIKKVTGKYSPLFTSAQKGRIVSNYKKGVVIAVLAKEHDCSVAKIRRILLDEGVQMRARGPVEGKKKTPKTVGDIVKSLKGKKQTPTEYLPQSAGPQTFIGKKKKVKK